MKSSVPSPILALIKLHAAQYRAAQASERPAMLARHKASRSTACPSLKLYTEASRQYREVNDCQLKQTACR